MKDKGWEEAEVCKSTHDGLEQNWTEEGTKDKEKRKGDVQGKRNMAVDKT